MSLLDALADEKDRENYAAKIYGVVVGVVTNNQDPEHLGRVKVKFPWLPENEESTWGRLAMPMAGPDRGMMFIPEVDDEVLVTFEHGNIRHPYIIGALWNATDKPPSEKEDDGENNLRIIKSRSGHLIKLDDTSDSEKIEIIDKSENNKITIDSSENKMILEVDGDIELKAANGKILLEANSVEIKSSAETKIEAGSTMDVKAGQTTTIQGQTVNIN